MNEQGAGAFVVWIETDGGIDYYGPFRKYPRALLDRLEEDGVDYAVRPLLPGSAMPAPGPPARAGEA